MKKILLSALFMGATFCVNAQVQFDNEIKIVPGTFTKNGKTNIVSFSSDFSTIKIYDADLNLTKQITPADLGAYSKRYKERAVVRPTIAIPNYEYVNVGMPGHYDETIAASSTSELVQKVKEVSGLNEGWQIFTDYKGRTCCFNSYDNCFEEETFGKTYPIKSYTIIDGYIHTIIYEYRYGYPDNYEESAEWTKVEGTERVTQLDNFEQWLQIYDFDNNVLYDKSITCCQTLFNDDDKWEYLAPLYGKIEKTYESLRKEMDYEGGEKIILEREVIEGHNTEGWAIYNEDGDKIIEINLSGFRSSWIDYMYRINGKLYFEITASKSADDSMQTMIFVYDPSSSDIRQISSSKSERFFDVEGRTINLKADGNADAALFSMNGMKVASAKSANGKRLSIDAGNVPAGVYNVTLMKNGRVAESQKVLLK